MVKLPIRRRRSLQRNQHGPAALAPPHDQCVPAGWRPPRWFIGFRREVWEELQLAIQDVRRTLREQWRRELRAEVDNRRSRHDQLSRRVQEHENTTDRRIRNLAERVGRLEEGPRGPEPDGRPTGPFPVRGGWRDDPRRPLPEGFRTAELRSVPQPRPRSEEDDQQAA